MALDLGINVPGAEDVKVKSSNTDTKAGTLIEKLTSSDSSISISISNQGGVEKINLTQTGGPIAVTSVFGRTGAVVSVTGDYDAIQVDYDNGASGLAATDVQAAIDEIAASGFGGIYGGSGSLSGDTVVTMFTDKFQFDSTGQTGLLTVDSTNNKVGVGTAFPLARLHVSGTGIISEIIDTSTDTANANISFRNDGGVIQHLSMANYGTSAAGTSFGLSLSNIGLIFKAGTGNMAIGTLGAGIVVLGSSNTEAIRIDSSQNVGIGTPTPLTHLHVSGTGLQSIRSESTTNTSNASFSVLNDGGISNNLTLTNFGSTAAGTFLGVSLNDLGVLSKSGGSDLAIGTPAGTGELVFGTNNVKGLRVDVSQNVTIPNGSLIVGADTSPTATLELVGAGTTSATIALDVKDSALTQMFKITDDGAAIFGTGAATRDFNVNGLMRLGNGGTSEIFIDNATSGSLLTIKDEGAGFNVFNLQLGTTGSVTQFQTDGGAFSTNKNLRLDPGAVVANLYVNNSNNGIQINGANDIGGTLGVSINSDGLSGVGVTAATVAARWHVKNIVNGSTIAAWGFNGPYSRYEAGIAFTDSSTAASGTATNAVFHSYGRPTLAATNLTVTTTHAATFYITGDVIAGTNQTLTNTYSVWVDAGRTRLDGGVEIDSAEAYYLGDRNTDSTWRIIRSGDDLLMQQREAGTYNTKQTISGA